MTGYPILENLTPDEWAVVAIGCVAVIMVPAVVIGGAVAAAEWGIRAVRRRRAPTLGITTIPTVPAAVPAAGIDAEWDDIIIEMEKSK
ncbi:hypothetical protein FJ955_02055 [Mesorhizobium sp. B2-2-2]|uniref:hypothetical protein n=1 Tax=Mesorhizobium sp. B2-2-2 TaxID=2589964 RepID=UPI00112907A7|nr:hypothetical protein [Mesorhizobium sp. B2-2-2]TPM33555.1 hypothetical protein FJ955_02055 [Mesorhizobium sp. B2-2-2]